MRRDPRLDVIEFLRDIDKGSGVQITFPQGCNEERYGLHWWQFCDMVREMLVTGIILDSICQSRADLARVLEENMRRGGSIQARLSTAGRIYLWELEEKLFAGRSRDDFGILWAKKHWERDLFLRMFNAAPDRPLAAVFCDIDHFKPVNDRLGHARGDEVLKQILTLAREHFEAFGAEGYRYGGDEFGAIALGLTLERAHELAEGLRSEVRDKMSKQADLQPEYPTISVGVTVVTARVPPEDLHKFVDRLEV